MNDMEQELIRKLKLIEALHAGAATSGEKDAATEALRRINDRLTQERQQAASQSVEYSFSMTDPWKRRLFRALLRRYSIEPYRYARQRYTTVMARVPKHFVDNTLWPEYLEMSKLLEKFLEEATERIIAQAIHSDASEATIRQEPKQIEMF